MNSFADFIVVSINVAYYVGLCPFRVLKSDLGATLLLKGHTLQRLLCFFLAVISYWTTFREFRKQARRGRTGRDAIFYFEAVTDISALLLQVSFHVSVWLSRRKIEYILQQLVSLDKRIAKVGIFARYTKITSLVLCGWYLVSSTHEVLRPLIGFGYRDKAWSLRNIVWVLHGASNPQNDTSIESPEFYAYGFTFLLIVSISFHTSTLYFTIYCFIAISITVWNISYSLRRNLKSFEASFLGAQEDTAIQGLIPVGFVYADIRRICALMSEVYGHVTTWMLVYSVTSLAKQLDTIMEETRYDEVVSGVTMISLVILSCVVASEAVVNVRAKSKTFSNV